MATLESIQAKIAKLQAQAEAIVVSKSTVVLDKIRDLMEKHGIGVSDIEAHVGKRRGRKAGATAAVKQSTSAAKYVDLKTGATWSGRGRAPGWIASVKDRSKFLATGAAPKSAATAQKTPKAGRYVRGPQPALYADPKTGATWSGRGRAPAWIANAKDRTKFLISDAAAPASTAKAKAKKAAPAKAALKTTAKKAAAKKAAAKKVAVKKAAAEKLAAPARKAAQKNGAAAKSPVTRKARVPKRTAKSEGSVDVAVTPAHIEVASAPAAA
ncbi:H-NS family nucleoid-associated regulatory protein [Paraburkholderia sp. BR10936]|uniref:H-NS family nucleoid-associated regulatory protein n=1 Tax=Paraburkholderia sp. BR10936 TaxID=3236993 RepID=UPI0034D1A9F4